jgi:hypothetical protein
MIIGNTKDKMERPNKARYMESEGKSRYRCKRSLMDVLIFNAYSVKILHGMPKYCTEYEKMEHF